MNGKNEIRVAELFAGIGGFRLGLEQANNNREFLQKQKTESLHGSTDITRRSSRVNGFRVIWANEWDKYAASIYRKNFGEKELVEGDITKIDADNIPDFDLLCGGFPCQPFSVAGKRQGFKDLRGTMFFEVARIAEAKRPKLLLLENVKGLLSHADGGTFETIIRTLDELGYDVEWQVLNSKHFGVPQNRERVFIIGHLRGTGTRQIFPISESDELSFEDATGEQRVSSCLDANYFKGARKQHTFIKSGDNKMSAVSHSVRSGGRGSLDRHSLDLIKVGDVWEGSQCRVYDPNGIAPTVHKSGGCTEPLIIADRTRSYAGLGRNLESPKPLANTLSGVQKDNLVLLDNFGGNIKQRVKSDGVAWTLDGSKTGVMHEQSIRRLTPVECERLQGFPDGWTNGVSDTQRYKCLGNAVTVNVIKFLGKKLLEVACIS